MILPLYQDVPVALCHFDLEHRFADVNNCFAALSGLPIADHIGRPIEEVLPTLTLQVQSRLRQVVASGCALASDIVQEDRPSADNARRVFEISYQPVVDGNSKITGVSCVFTDKSGAESIRQQPRDIDQIPEFAKSSGDWFWEMDAELRYQWFSAEMEAITGVAPELLYGRTRQELGAPDMPDELLAEHFAALEAHEAFYNFIYRAAGPNGLRWVRVSGVPFFDKDGEFQGYWGFGSDITEQVTAHDAAQSTHEELFQAIESLNETFVLCDRDDRIVLCNDRFRKMNAEIVEYTRPGTPYVDFLNAGVQAGLMPQADNNPEEWVAQRMRQHLNPNGLIEVERQDGYQVLIKEEKTKHGGIVQTTIDVTERKRLEEALRERDAIMRQVGDAVPVLMVYLDRSFRYRYANQTAAIWYNREIDDIIGLSIDDVFEEKQILQGHQRLASVLQGANIHFEDKRTYPDGVHRITETSFLPHYGETGEVEGIFALTRDVSDHRRAERALRDVNARFKDFADAASDWFWEIDAELKVTYLSDTVKTVNGGIDPKEFYGKIHMMEIADEAESQAALDCYLADVAAHRPFKEFEFVYTMPDGDKRHGSISGRPIFGDDGEYLGYRGVGRDITRRKRIELDLHAAIAKAEQLSREKSKLLSIVAHDLRSPFNSLLGFTELFSTNLEQWPLERVASYAKQIHETGENVYALIENLLEFANAQMNNIEPEFAATDISKVAQEVVRSQQPTAKNKTIQLASDVTAATVLADRQMIATVLRNLVGNAIKFTPAGGSVAILNTVTDEGVEITVRDNGIGITSEKVDTLFRLDVKNSTPGTNGEKGSGLGIIVCQEFVAKHGADLKVKSKVGGGSSFSFVLPFAESRRDVAGVAAK